jgi:hypothetical protein
VSAWWYKDDAVQVLPEAHGQRGVQGQVGLEDVVEAGVLLVIGKHIHIGANALDDELMLHHRRGLLRSWANE